MEIIIFLLISWFVCGFIYFIYRTVQISYNSLHIISKSILCLLCGPFAWIAGICLLLSNVIICLDEKFDEFDKFVKRKF